ncbi:hypothetical protein [Burkholderia gladioli]|uniref:hypothetical protein n=1 Tax=Burkholderia gladioli TaxID=28095 RepID=UPI00164150FE|nr:hypothetical protein [Burkholderia gladioli]
MPKHDDIDEAFKVFTAIVSEADNISRSTWSEADTRLKVIDRVLFDVLGWSRNDAGVEERAGSGFTDYTLRKRGSARVIVEAKKDSISFDLSGRQSGRAYKLNGPVFNAASRGGLLIKLLFTLHSKIASLLALQMERSGLFFVPIDWVMGKIPSKGRDLYFLL